MTDTKFEDIFSEEIWDMQYRFQDSDGDVDDTFMRVASAVASAEKTDDLRMEWADKFYQMLTGFATTAGGRIYANAGTGTSGTTLLNCFIGPTGKNDIDSMEGIYSHLINQALTLKSEGGWGENFSYLRPRGAFIHGISVESPGAVRFMELFDKSSDIVTSGSGKKPKNKGAKKKIRKGAQMAVLDCIAGSSLLDTIDGKKPIKDLIGKRPHLFCTDGNGNVFVRQADKIWKKGVKKTLRVVFDNGDSIECTPNHQFMLSDGTYKNAESLEFGEFPSSLTTENHKVLYVEESIEQEVFDVSMPAPYHNFSVNGVFIHNCTHPDIIEFITAKQTPGKLTKFNMSVNCTDAFMKKVVILEDLKTSGKDVEDHPENEWDLQFPDTTFKKYKKEWDGVLQNWVDKGYPVITYDTVKVTTLWDLIMKSTYNRAEPGVMFLDRANHFHPANYVPNMRIKASNPCVVKGTLVNTPYGYTKVEDIFEGDIISTVLGAEKVKTIEKHDSVLTYKVKFSDGGEEIVTAAHKYKAFRTSGKTKIAENIRVDELNIGDSVWVEPTKSIENLFIEFDYNQGLKTGILLGDGCYTEKTLSRSMMKIASNIDDVDYNNRVKELFGDVFNSDDISKDSKSMNIMIKKEFQQSIIDDLVLTPSYSHEKRLSQYNLEHGVDISHYIGILDGLLATDGTINFKSNNPSIRWITSSKELAQDIRRLLLYVGAHGRISESNEIGGTINGRVIERKHTKYTVSITGTSVKSYFKHTHLNKIHKAKYDKLKHLVSNTRLTGNNWKASITSIEENGYNEVYDLYCEESDTWITSGYVQQGCGEQMMPQAGVCLLGSINLTQFVRELSGEWVFDFEKLATYTGWLTRFLDNVNSITQTPLPEYQQFVDSMRRIGIGILGWGSLLYMLQIKFGSCESHTLRNKIMSTISSNAYMTSIDLAEEKGMFPLCEPSKHADGEFIKSLDIPKQYMKKMLKTGIRNSSLMSCQPTGSTSIFANLVSGGVEPVFDAQYIRTVILGEGIPKELKEHTPKWFEGEWFETDIFKFDKEGDDDILKGELDGTVYKIDRNRGLTKEVLCEDYGIRWLKKHDLYDPDADYLVSAMDLDVNTHVDDLAGFSRYVDSSISKTINVPNDYSYEEFKKIYLTAYKSGYIRGITTYRAGIMSTVLSTTDTSTNGDEEIILDDVKLPDSAEASMKTIRAEGKKWYLTVVYHENDKRPFALFVKTNDHEKTVATNDAVDVLLKLAVDKKLPQRHVDKVINKIGKDNNVSKITRIISFLLRHGVLIKNICMALDKVDGIYAGSFIFQIKKFLQGYIKDGELVEGAKCEACGSDKVIFSEGCFKCSMCGNSKCG